MLKTGAYGDLLPSRSKLIPRKSNTVSIAHLVLLAKTERVILEKVVEKRRPNKFDVEKRRPNKFEKKQSYSPNRG